SRSLSALVTLRGGLADLRERCGRRGLQREAYPALERVAVDVLCRALTLAVGVHLERLLGHPCAEEQIAHRVGSRLRELEIELIAPARIGIAIQSPGQSRRLREHAGDHPDVASRF